MLVFGFQVTILTVRLGRGPFFFLPQHFLIFDLLTLIAFAGLTGAGIMLSQRSDGHRRLTHAPADRSL